MVSKNALIEMDSLERLKRLAKPVKPKREDNPSVTEQLNYVLDIIEDNPMKKMSLLVHEMKVSYREIYGIKGLDYLEEYLLTFFSVYEKSPNRKQLFQKDMKKILTRLKTNIPDTDQPVQKVKTGPAKCLKCQDKRPNYGNVFHECKDCLEVLCSACSTGHLKPGHHLKQIPA